MLVVTRKALFRSTLLLSCKLQHKNKNNNNKLQKNKNIYIRDTLQDIYNPTQNNNHENEKGVFQPFHIKKYPVRAAIDVGTGNVLSLSIARVDVLSGGIQKLFYQTQLPLFLEKTNQNENKDDEYYFLTEKSLNDIKNKFFILNGILKKDQYEGLSEKVAVINYPLNFAKNLEPLLQFVKKELKIDVRVLGKDYFLPISNNNKNENENNINNDKKEAIKQNNNHNSGLAGLIAKTKQKQNPKKKLNQNNNNHHHLVPLWTTKKAIEQQNYLNFLSHCYAVGCTKPQRFILLLEDAKNGNIIIQTLNTSVEEEIKDIINENEENSEMLFSLLENLEKEESEKMERLNTAQLNYFHNHNKNEKDALLLEYTIPLSITDVHEFCITKVQKRNINIKNENNNNIPLHLSHSPNPLLPSEFNILENYIFNLLQPHIPFFIKRKLLWGGVVAVFSFNGGVFNLCARACQKSHIFLETLKINALYHFCGLTDVLLHQTFPNYNVVLPSLAFGLAILRSLSNLHKILYIAENNIATSYLLLSPPENEEAQSLWTHDRRLALYENFQNHNNNKNKKNYFDRPHRKEAPAIAPSATYQVEGKWNEKGSWNSYRGT